jgi:hypothetical protein
MRELSEIRMEEKPKVEGERKQMPDDAKMPVEDWGKREIRSEVG